MNDEIKKWWLLVTEKETHFEVSDNYYNHSELCETSKPFWGTNEELVQHIQKCWFTENEITLLHKGWQSYQQLALAIKNSNRELHWRWRGTFKEQRRSDNDVAWQYAFKSAKTLYQKLDRDELKNAPWLKHDVIVDADNAKIYLNFTGKHPEEDEDIAWTKTLHIICLDQNGEINNVLPQNITTIVGEFITNLQANIK